MLVYIIRHGWAGHYGDPRWPDDRLRPLAPEGRVRFTHLVQKLVIGGFSPAVVATSPLVRCRQTAEIVADLSPAGPGLVELAALAPGSDLHGVMSWVNENGAEGMDVALVGHAPDVGHLAAASISQQGARIRFPKGAVAAIRFDGTAAPGFGELRWLATAQLMGV